MIPVMKKTLTHADIRRAILASLTPDLLEKKYRDLLAPDDPPETGHCAVASEADYHLEGGRDAGFIPVVCGYATDGQGAMKFGAEREAALQKGWRRETHWWIRGPKDGIRGAGDIRDITVNQYPEPFPYENGHNTGFMQPQQKPSKRAQIVIDRVKALLGEEALAAYKKANLADFRRKSAQCRPNTRPRPQERPCRWKNLS